MLNGSKKTNCTELCERLAAAVKVRDNAWNANTAAWEAGEPLPLVPDLVYIMQMMVDFAVRDARAGGCTVDDPPRWWN